MPNKCLMVCFILLVQPVRQEKSDCPAYENIFFFIYDSLTRWEFWRNCKELGNRTILGLLHVPADFKPLEK